MVLSYLFFVSFVQKFTILDAFVDAEIHGIRKYFLYLSVEAFLLG